MKEIWKFPVTSGSEPVTPFPLMDSRYIVILTNSPGTISAALLVKTLWFLSPEDSTAVTQAVSAHHLCVWMGPWAWFNALPRPF